MKWYDSWDWVQSNLKLKKQVKGKPSKITYGFITVAADWWVHGNLLRDSLVFCICSKFSTKSLNNKYLSSNEGIVP